MHCTSIAGELDQRPICPPSDGASLHKCSSSCLLTSMRFVYCPACCFVSRLEKARGQPRLHSDTSLFVRSGGPANLLAASLLRTYPSFTFQPVGRAILPVGHEDSRSGSTERQPPAGITPPCNRMVKEAHIAFRAPAVLLGARIPPCLPERLSCSRDVVSSCGVVERK